MDYQLRERLQAAGARNTRTRRAVFAALKSSPAVTIGELRRGLSGQLDTASLYRTLNLFRRLDIVQDVVIAGSRKVELTDRFSPHHHHIACASCGRTVTIDDPDFEAQIVRLARARGFVHSSHSFEITGICPSCQQVKFSPGLGTL